MHKCTRHNYLLVDDRYQQATADGLIQPYVIDHCRATFIYQKCPNAKKAHIQYTDKHSHLPTQTTNKLIHGLFHPGFLTDIGTESEMNTQQKKKSYRKHRFVHRLSLSCMHFIFDVVVCNRCTMHSMDTRYVNIGL